jgi:predicted ATPase
MKSQLDFVKIEKLRSLEIGTPINIAPITILIGKNSAGKSTFARTFPLMRQSCEAKKRAPILWFGDRVDFGSFDESLQKSPSTRVESNKGEITFTFGMSVDDDNSSSIRRLVQERDEPLTEMAVIELSIRRRKDGSSTASRLRIDAFGFAIHIRTDQFDAIESITCNDLIWTPAPDSISDISYQSILPKIGFFQRSDLNSEKPRRYVEYKPFDNHIKAAFEGKQFAEYAEFISDAIISAPIMPKGELAEHVERRLPFFGLKKNKQDRILLDLISELENHALIARINNFLELFDGALSEYFSGVKYIEPLRATAQRYYRKQELAVDEIDSKGENLAMFLDSLHNYQLRNFNQWTVENFGFSARTENQGGHVTILIKEGSGSSESNLADIGFGFSQILPVITQVWLSTTPYLPKTRKTTCMVIEQPELHLHPAFQAKLADVFASAITNHRTKASSFIIETHSNHIINRFGQLISEGKLKSNEVQILIFEKNEDNSGTNIRLSGYNEKGYLQNWPIGFFEPETD